MGLIDAIAKQRIMPNLLMLVMLLSGALVVGKMETRFFPAFEIQTVVVSATWRGAAAEDVSEGLLPPLEAELRDTPNLKTMSSVARDGSGVVYLEFPESADIQEALDDVRRHLARALAKLPANSERPRARVIERRDDIMRVSLAGSSIAELRALARQIETELAALGVARVETSGLPKDEIQILLSSRQLRALGLAPREVGRQLAAANIDATAGDLSSSANTRVLRVLERRQSPTAFADMRIVDGGGNVTRLGDVAEIRRAPQSEQRAVFFNGKPAVEFRMVKNAGGNILRAADKIHDYLDARRPTLPAGVELAAHRERWRAVKSRIDLLLENGLQGLALVGLFLLLFLRGRLALWVAAGIPATFMVALAVLWATGGTLNMISLFAFIMVAGIVVDDAIVVGENSLYHLQRGATPLQAATRGAREMFPAVFSSTFTTLASFIPLLIVGGVIGAIMEAIPLVVACVLCASLFECFMVLPGHMRGAFAAIAKTRPARWRAALDSAFDRFQEGAFRRSVALALRYRWVTLTAALVCLVLTCALLAGGLLKYRFFPGAELSRVAANVSFVAGTPRADVERFVEELAQSARKAEARVGKGEKLILHISAYLGEGGARRNQGNEQAVLRVELTDPEERSVGARAFARAWRKVLPTSPGLDSLSLREARGGPSGEDLQARLRGADYSALKAASLELQAALTNIPGVSRPSDDMPFGKRQTVFEVNARGRALGLSSANVAAQLRDATNGYKAQTLHEGRDETDVRVYMSDAAANINDYRLRLPAGGFAALSDVAALRERQGFDSVQREDSSPVVNVVANVDFDATTAGRVIAQLERDILPAIASRHGVAYSFEGARADERETTQDMKTGLIVAFVSIFVILAAVFSSWTLPFAILLTAPFGIIGAMLGHWLLGHSMSILSAFGVFALNGIIVNDSIILAREYLARRAANPHARADSLIVDSVCRRLRAIFLTSLTTIGGLLPLLFEKSTQAQFLIPMAISLSFGLGFATLLILYVMPAFLSAHELAAAGLRRLWRGGGGAKGAARAA